MLITGTVMLVTWSVTLLTRSYMRKNGSESPRQDAVGASWRQGQGCIQKMWLGGQGVRCRGGGGGKVVIMYYTTVNILKIRQTSLES